MVYGGDRNAQWGPRPPGGFDPEATQIVPGYGQQPPVQPPHAVPAPQPYPAQAPVPQPYAGQSYPPQHVPAPPQAPGPSDPAGPSKRTLVLIGVVAAGLLLAGGVGVALLLHDPVSPTTSSPTAPPSDGPAPAETPTSAAAPSNAAQVDIGARSTDPKPLTVAELFPGGQSVSYGGATYTIYGTEAVNTCSKAADGQLATALTAGGCTQIVRATVADPSGQYLVTIGVANLSTQKAADDVYDLLQDPTKNGYFTRLNGAGPAKDFAASRDTVIGSLARGHYVIFAIGGRSGSTGASLADEQLKTALKNLRQHTNETLARRS